MIINEKIQDATYGYLYLCKCGAKFLGSDSYLPKNIFVNIEHVVHSKETEFVIQEEENVMIRSEGKPFSCTCGCNVFHTKMDKVYGKIYQCNACDNEYQDS